MSAYATTIPAVLYTGIALFIPLSNFFLIAAILFIFMMLLAIISVYPKRKKRNRK
jgi:predicted membrane protein